MDLDFWAARNHRLSNSGSRVYGEDEEADEVKAWFPCPFCYVEIELSLLCVHLQEEHCFDLKNAVCPICAANLGKDPLGHFTMQHAQSVKRRKKCQKAGNIVKDLRDLSSFLSANNSLTSRSIGNEPAHDTLLSDFLRNMPMDSPREDISSRVFATSDEESRLSPLDEVTEQDFEEKMRRALFIQDLLLSTIF
ncbi:Protein DEHYDRATION-INDUCED 19 homolog 7 [Striga hermonthica]|uniref:Protein DEHYDRATION-INDUCED 19 homolog 7 n=1 Tax=Striga hermonthica TaxID=68872 RepID=A0A9N7N2I6_STRHE|nr:Protein DEHYDRATION-INDUCED 19 homolog 7 [Striga hermonthica]